MANKLCFDLALFYRRIIYLWRCGDTRPATIIVILAGYIWTALLMLPGETIARPTYLHMREVIETDLGWAAVFFVVATLQVWRLFALTTGRSRWGDFVLKVMACGVFTFTSLACLTSLTPTPAAMAGDVAVTLASVWDLLRFDTRRGCGAHHFPTGECPLESLGGRHGRGD